MAKPIETLSIKLDFKDPAGAQHIINKLSSSFKGLDRIITGDTKPAIQKLRSEINTFAGQGNNQMLLGDTITGEIKRFLVGPRECEITGMAWSHDGKTMFVGIQHPGEEGNSHFPGGGESVPRSCVIAINKDDGSLMG